MSSSLSATIASTKTELSSDMPIIQPILAKAGVEVNRKMLADLAVNDANAFAQMVAVAKENQ